MGVLFQKTVLWYLQFHNFHMMLQTVQIPHTQELANYKDNSIRV